MQQDTSTQQFDNANFLDQFKDPNFDPVEYAQKVVITDKPWTSKDDERVELLCSRLAFAVSDLTQQINSLVEQNQSQLYQIMLNFDQARQDVTNLKDQFSQVDQKLVQWRQSISEPRDLLANTLKKIRKDQTVLHFLQAIQYLINLLQTCGQPTSIPNVPDSHLITIANALERYSYWTNTIDFKGIDVFDTVIDPYANECESILYTRLCFLVGKENPACTQQLAIEAIHVLGKLPAWHKQYRGQVGDQVNVRVNEFLQFIDSQPSQADPKKKDTLNTDLVIGKFSTIVAYINSEATYIANILQLQPLDKTWLKFWKSVARNMHFQTHIGKLHMYYLSLIQALTSQINVNDTPFDMLCSTLQPLVSAYCTNFKTTVSQSMTPVLTVNSTWSTTKQDSTKHLHPDVLKQALQGPVRTLVQALDLAFVEVQALASMVATLTDALSTLLSHSSMKLKEYTDPTLSSQLSKPQIQQLAIVNASYTVYTIGTDLLDNDQEVLIPLQNKLTAFQQHGTLVVDTVLQTVLAAIQGSILRPRLNTSSSSSSEDSVSWEKDLNTYFNLLNQIYTSLELGVPKDIIQIWQTVVTGTILEHVPVSVAMTVKSTSPMSQLASALDRLPFQAVDLFHAHKQVLIDLLRLDWSSLHAVNADHQLYKHLCGLYSKSPVIVAVFAASVLGKSPLWRIKNVSPREFLTWILDQVNDLCDLELPTSVYDLIVQIVPSFKCVLQSRK